MTKLSPQIIQQIQDEISKGNKILAIKIFKEATDVSLLQAKEVIEGWENAQKSKAIQQEYFDDSSQNIETNTNYSFGEEVSQSIQKTSLSEKEVENKVYIYLTNNQKLEAVKWVKENKNMGLKEAKDYVESLEQKQNTQNPDYAYENTEMSVNEKPGENEGKIEFHLSPITYGDTPEKESNATKNKITLLLILGLIAYLIYKFAA